MTVPPSHLRRSPMPSPDDVERQRLRTRVLRSEPAEIIAEPANELHLQQLVTRAEFGPDVSVSWVQIAGRHRRLRTATSTRVYIVMTGALTIQLGVEDPVPARAGEVVVVPRGTPYELSGTATYLVVNAPAFTDGDDEYLS
jgi:mannose-6-phosphate isomerase-like protein (cupin superfamily)